MLLMCDDRDAWDVLAEGDAARSGTAAGSSSPVGTVVEVGIPTLFTATLEVELGEDSFAVFHACHAMMVREVIEQLAVRIPQRYLSEVVVRRGVDLDHPVARRLVPSPALELLASLEDFNALGGPLAGGGVFNVMEWRGC